MFDVRTDLAVEETERVCGQQGLSHGISVHEEEYENECIKVTTVCIETENAGKSLGKPKGTYITLEAPRMAEEAADYHREISEKIAELLHRLIPEKKEVQTVLAAGLGNRSVTPDALGPQVVDNLCITRHILKEYGNLAFEGRDVTSLCAVAPGVMAQTGMETREILAGVIRQVKPDYLIAIDSLAARSLKRLCRTIQITDTGVCPGSGIGNYRHSLTEKSLGVPVIVIGIPTVVEAATIIQDSIGDFLHEISADNATAERDGSGKKLEEIQHLELTRKILPPQLNQMFVTSKDIDAQIKQMSYMISEGINIALGSLTAV